MVPVIGRRRQSLRNGNNRLGFSQMSGRAAPSQQSILAALVARPGGDMVCGRNYNKDWLFKLAPGIHDVRAVARELAQAEGVFIGRRGTIGDWSWTCRFYRALRALRDAGAIEAPSLIPIAEAFPACQRRVRDLRDGAYLDGARDRRYVRLTGNAAPSLPSTVVCRECGIELPGVHRLRKWCTACKANLFKRRNAQTAAKALKRRRAQLARAMCKFCGTTFTAAKSDQLFCSSACKQKAYRERKTTLA
jgi:hypothetical protein